MQCFGQRVRCERLRLTLRLRGPIASGAALRFAPLSRPLNAAVGLREADDDEAPGY
jgi:hypothetical protein